MADTAVRPPFFIAGLPRSGTTFLANFFTTAGVFCHHEALLGCENMEKYAERMRLRDYYQVGDSDSGLAWYEDRVRERFPNSLWVGIDRDATDVALSHMRLGMSVPTELMMDSHRKCLSRCDIMVKFQDLFLTETLRYLWQNVTGLRFDSRRAEMLAQMRVQPNLDEYLPRYRREMPMTVTPEARN